MPTDIGSVTPQHLAKLLQMVPADLTPSNLHAMFASGTMSDLLHAQAPGLKKFQQTSLWRDLFRELIGLQPESLQLSFTVGLGRYVSFLKGVGAGITAIDATHLDRLRYEKSHPYEPGTFRNNYLARPKLMCAWFAAGFRLNEAQVIIAEHGYQVATLRSYFKLLAHLSRRGSESAIPAEFIDSPIVGGLEPLERSTRCFAARRLINPDSRGHLVSLGSSTASSFTSRYWIPLEKKHESTPLGLRLNTMLCEHPMGGMLL